MRTRKGADTLLLAQVKILHEAILRPREKHVCLTGVEAHLIDSAFVFSKQVFLFISTWPSQIPRYHGAVGGRCSQQAVIRLVPHDVRTAEVQRWFPADAQI